LKKSLHRRVPRDAKSAIRVHPREFVFLDRVSGKVLFSVKAAPDGNMPVEETSTLLAMHCVLHSQSPSDFRYVLTVGDDLMHLVLPRAKKLIHSCLPSLVPIQISMRQQQVLRGIFQNRRNKEIASEINVTERTVKFHVSALLQKFKVDDRASLIQKVGDLVSSQGVYSGLQQEATPSSAAHGDSAETRDMRPALVSVAGGERRSGR
jgi:DNA-binding CsgD family transcriptional regulator